MENAAAGGCLQGNDVEARRVTTRPLLLSSHVAAPKAKVPRRFSTRAERRINLTLEQCWNFQSECYRRHGAISSAWLRSSSPCRLIPDSEHQATPGRRERRFAQVAHGGLKTVRLRDFSACLPD
jgi:hypothetical protein